MCNQTVCLVAAELERRGVTTVCLSLLRDVSAKVRPPRALAVPFRHGYPLDQPGEPDRQTAVITACLQLALAAGPPPVLADFT